MVARIGEDRETGPDRRPIIASSDASPPQRPAQLSTAAVAVDVALLTVRDDALQILLVQPHAPGTEGNWALPGGRVRDDENLDQAATRFLQDMAGIEAPATHLEQLRTYGEPERDPRARVVSVAYLALTPTAGPPRDPDRARFVPVEDLGRDDALELAFDHDRIVPDALERARAKLEYTALATAFVPEPFTLGELRRVYELVWGVELDSRNFRRKVLSSSHFVEATDETAPPGPEGGRPARLYRRGIATLLHPAMLRPGREPA